MGLHYVKLDRYASARRVRRRGQSRRARILLYEPTPWGPKITGADYLVDADDLGQGPPAGQTPELNGQIFHHFGAPNRFGLPTVLHAARLGVEGQPDRHVRELAQGSALRRAQQTRQVGCESSPSAARPKVEARVSSGTDAQPNGACGRQILCGSPMRQTGPENRLASIRMHRRSGVLRR